MNLSYFTFFVFLIGANTSVAFANEAVVYGQAACSIRIWMERKVTTVDFNQESSGTMRSLPVRIELKGFICEAEAVFAQWADVGLIRNLRLTRPDGKVIPGSFAKIREFNQVSDEAMSEETGIYPNRVYCTCVIY